MFNEDLDLYPEISNRAGLQPGELVFMGEKRQEHTTLTIIRYNTEGWADERTLTSVEAIPQLIAENENGVTWINLSGLQQVQWVKTLGDLFGAHPLMLEDILNTNQRPKLEDFNDSLFIELNMLTWHESACEISSEQLSLLMRKGLVVTFQEVDEDVLNPLRAQIRSGSQHLRQFGADYLTYAIVDAVVDHYFIVLENLSDQIEDLEDEVTQHPDPATLKQIHQLKRDLLFLRKAVWPLRELVSGLARGTSPFISRDILIYLRDVYDHTIQIMDIVETFRDMVSGILDIYLSSLSNQMNQVMKVLTIISTLFIPLTFIAGVYGMNFDNMPELRWHWGYFAVMGFMFTLLVLMLAYFKKKKWF